MSPPRDRAGAAIARTRVRSLWPALRELARPELAAKASGEELELEALLGYVGACVRAGLVDVDTLPSWTREPLRAGGFTRRAA